MTRASAGKARQMASRHASPCKKRPKIAVFLLVGPATSRFPQRFPQLWKSWGRNRMAPHRAPVLRQTRPANVAQTRSCDLVSLLSKLAVGRRTKGVEHAAYDGGEVSRLHLLITEPNPYDQILQHLQSVAPVISAQRLSARRARDEGRAACSGILLLGPIRRDAVRPARTRPFAARDLRRLGQLRGQTRPSRRHGAEPVD